MQNVCAIYGEPALESCSARPDGTFPDQQFALNEGILFRGLDGKLYVARYEVVYVDEWEVFEVRIEWWHSEPTCYEG